MLVQPLEALNRNAIQKQEFALVNWVMKAKSVTNVVAVITVTLTVGDAAVILQEQIVPLVIRLFASVIRMDSALARQMFQANVAILAKVIHLVSILKIMKVARGVSVLEDPSIVLKLVTLGMKKEEMIEF